MSGRDKDELPPYLQDEAVPEEDKMDPSLTYVEKILYRKRQFYKWRVFAIMSDGRRVLFSKEEGYDSKKKALESIDDYTQSDRLYAWVRKGSHEISWWSGGDRDNKHTHDMVPRDAKFSVERYRVLRQKIKRTSPKLFKKIKAVIDVDTIIISLGYSSHTKGLLSYATEGHTSVVYRDILRSPIPEKDKLPLELMVRNSILNAAPLPGNIWLHGACGEKGTELKGDDLVKYMWSHIKPKTLEKWRRAIERVDQLRGSWK